MKKVFISALLMSLLFSVAANAQMPENTTSETTIRCLAMNIVQEADHTPKDMHAVAHVTINRVAAGFANTVCKVVYQPHQFNWLSSPKKVDKKSSEWTNAYKVAIKVLAGEPDLTHNSLYFHDMDSKTHAWASKFKVQLKTDSHIFKK